MNTNKLFQTIKDLGKQVLESQTNSAPTSSQTQTIKRFASSSKKFKQLKPNPHIGDEAMVNFVFYPNAIKAHVKNKTVDGVWITGDDYRDIDRGIDPKQLSKIALEMLESSLCDVEHPTKWAGRTKHFLEKTGFKDMKSYMKDAILIQFTRKEDDLYIDTMPNSGASKGFYKTKEDKNYKEKVNDPSKIGLSMLKLVETVKSN